MERARKSKRKSRSATSSSAQTSISKSSLTETKIIAPATPMNKAIQALQDNVDQAKRLANQQSQPLTAINVPPPLMSNKDFEAKFARQPKRGKFFRTQDTTPTLTSVPVSLNSVPVIASSAVVPTNTDLAPPLSVPQMNVSTNKLLRTNSLALSDFSSTDMKEEDLNQDFVNPFDDEHEIFCINPTPRLVGSSDVRKLDQPQSNFNGRSSLNQRYVTPGIGTKHPNPPPVPRKANCFCNCDRGECICSDLADHFLHRMDGLQLYLHEDQERSEARNPHSSSR